MQAVVCFVVVVLVALCHSHDISKEANSAEQARKYISSTKSMQYLGSWGEKAYFFGTIPRIRDAADAECQADMLKLVSIESPEELEFVKYIISSEGYWTSGVATFKFTWGEGQVIDLPYDSQRSCMAVSSSGLFAAPCTTLYYPLCELNG